VLSSNGRVRLRRVRWHAKGEGSETPLDVLLDRAARTFSSGVREMACRLNLSSTSFAKTAENLGRLASIQISGESVRQLVEHEGKRAARQVRRGRVDPGWDASDCVTEGGQTRVYVGCDGVKVPLVTDQEKRKRRQTIKQKRQRSGKRRRALAPLKRGADDAFKEFRVVTAYAQDQEHRTVAVTSGDCEQTGRLMRSVALAIKLSAADESIASVDGAPWIRNQLELHRITDHVNLDYYHLKDYAQRTRREAYGEDSEEGRRWLAELTRLFLEAGVEEAWDYLIAWRKNLRGRKRKAADRLLGYVAERRGMIRYREFRERGWQIGSGPTEAQCKTTTLRLKGRGRRWDAGNAEALMALAALDASHAWDSWWKNPYHDAA
jgi:hypothetical protein